MESTPVELVHEAEQRIRKAQPLPPDVPINPKDWDPTLAAHSVWQTYAMKDARIAVYAAEQSKGDQEVIAGTVLVEKLAAQDPAAYVISTRRAAQVREVILACLTILTAMHAPHELAMHMTIQTADKGYLIVNFLNFAPEHPQLRSRLFPVSSFFL